MIHISFGIDDRYAMPCGVLIYSILRTNDRDFSFHILAEKLSDESKALLEETIAANSKNSKIIFYELNDKKIDNLITFAHYNKTIYFRLNIPELLPQNVEKCLYLDSDMLCVDSLNDLWDLNIDNYALAAIINNITSNGKEARRLNYDPSLKYFNSGALLLNLKYWRENNCGKDIIKLIEDNANSVRFPDQDGINYILKGKILEISPKYNLYAEVLRDPNRLFKKIEYNHFAEAIKNPCIIHYANDRKPWHYEQNYPFDLLWRFVKEKSPYKNYPLSSYNNMTFENAEAEAKFRARNARNQSKIYRFFKTAPRKLKAAIHHLIKGEEKIYKAEFNIEKIYDRFAA
ncbi:MAG: glycosyltransferase family 8 protein [Helicobacteraceae bacterium]|jgi:lipopolysaccharide biosynthesis glycosyltransferase|nr:glycosyltransferase family 8 protein [Helicobacteraceae bacterium]